MIDVPWTLTLLFRGRGALKEIRNEINCRFLNHFFCFLISYLKSIGELDDEEEERFAVSLSVCCVRNLRMIDSFGGGVKVSVDPFLSEEEL